MNLNELKTKPIPELLEIAKEMGLDNLGRSRKQEIIASVLRKHAKSGEAIYGERFTPRYEEFYEPTNQFQGGEMIAGAWDLTRQELDEFDRRITALEYEANL